MEANKPAYTILLWLYTTKFLSCTQATCSPWVEDLGALCNENPSEASLMEHLSLSSQCLKISTFSNAGGEDFGKSFLLPMISINVCISLAKSNHINT